MIDMGRRNPGSSSAADAHEPVAAYADLQTDRSTQADVDWHAAEFDHFAEQTLGANRAF
jgi:hypothetical protein